MTQLTAPVHVPSHYARPVKYKNLLQLFTSRFSNDLLVYQSFNEGEPHISKFWSTVRVAGISYSSEPKFPQKRAAEQEVARLALKTILEKTIIEGTSIVNEASEMLSTPNSKDIFVTRDPKDAVVPYFVADKSEDKVAHTESSKIHSTCQKQESCIQATCLCNQFCTFH
ncbi:hypothetical protein VIGAN_04247000 [Vigna angularis var. angularis]|uniref:DRBM domain-containing protein n=1 Tax=Vigna angularis var. angularis TaxID=157739 RepID=A0A0S3RWM9_PHAAN|nr:hypothetical protein VIGAN_04247000 [Vigna angularis var. angularis]